MSHRRRAAAPGWGQPACPLCGGELIWPLHVPKRIRPGEHRRRIPLDRAPTDDPTARYAVFGSGAAKTSRYLEDDEQPDVLDTVHPPHFATCPDGITPEQLASMTQQNGQHR